MEPRKAVVLCVALMSCVQAVPPPEESQRRGAVRLTPAEIAASTTQAVVVVRADDGLGSGFLVAPDLVVTSFHVVKGAHYVGVETSDRAEHPVAGVTRWDSVDDIAVLRLASALPATPLKVSAAPPSLGEFIVAIGHPLGLHETVSTGVISGLRQEDGTHFMQISAPISPGSSGGPVLNERAEVVGIVRGTFRDGQALNFATPASRILRLLHQADASHSVLAFGELTGAEKAAASPFWCEKQPSATDVRVCMSTLESCQHYGGGDCFEQSDAWCIWRFGFTDKKASLCTATKGECERNFSRVPPDASPTPCFQAQKPEEVN